MFSSLFTEHKVAKEYIFTTALQKDKSNSYNRKNYSSAALLKVDDFRRKI